MQVCVYICVRTYVRVYVYSHLTSGYALIYFHSSFNWFHYVDEFLSSRALNKEPLYGVWRYCRLNIMFVICEEQVKRDLVGG